MPLLTMLKPGQCGWLQAITPEHIKDTSAENSTALAMRLEKELEEISKKLREEGIENAWHVFDVKYKQALTTDLG